MNNCEIQYVSEFLPVLLALCVPRMVHTSSGFIRACYVSRTSFMPMSAIPPTLCTHVIFGFAMINNQGILVPVHSTDKQLYKELISMKKTNPGLRVLVSVQDGFDAVITANTTVKNNFAKSSLSFLKTYGFDGLDLDWEPAFPLKKEKVLGYMDIVMTIKKWLSNSDTGYFTLSAALYASKPKAEYMYNISLLGQILDFATIMTYDYHLYLPEKDTVTGFNSPLFTADGEPEYWSVNGSVDFYLKSKMPRGKILVGFPTYGRTYKLKDPKQYGLHAPAIGRGDPGPVRKLHGIYTYQDTCYSVKYGNTVWDDNCKVPYLHNGTTWLSFDDIESASEKCQWMKSNKLGGVGIWAIHMDDFNNRCKGGIFPLISAWKKCVESNTL